MRMLWSGEEETTMSGLAIRDDIGSEELRRRARRERDGRVSARLIAIANALEGMDRASAARLAGMDRQTLRDWVHRYNDWSHEVVVLGGVTTTVKVAHIRLCHSRMFLVRAYPRETQEMVFDAHDHAFHLFGGMCRRGIYDNMTTAVEAVFVGKERRFNR